MKQLIGVILAGGRGQRLGGEDKGLFKVRHQPLVEHVIDILSPQVEQIVLSINRNTDIYSQYELPLILDRNPDFLGPLSGLLSVMQFLTQQSNNSEYANIKNSQGHFDLLVVPCDTPLLPSNLSSRLIAAKRTGNFENRVVVACDGQRIQPLFSLVSTSLLTNLTQYLASGRRKVLDWIISLKPIIVEFPQDTLAFSNINTYEECIKIEQYLE